VSSSRLRRRLQEQTGDEVGSRPGVWAAVEHRALENAEPLTNVFDFCKSSRRRTSPTGPGRDRGPGSRRSPSIRLESRIVARAGPSPRRSSCRTPADQLHARVFIAAMNTAAELLGLDRGGRGCAMKLVVRQRRVRSRRLFAPLTIMRGRRPPSRRARIRRANLSSAACADSTGARTRADSGLGRARSRAVPHRRALSLDTALESACWLPSVARRPLVVGASVPSSLGQRDHAVDRVARRDQLVGASGRRAKVALRVAAGAGIGGTRRRPASSDRERVGEPRQHPRGLRKAGCVVSRDPLAVTIRSRPSRRLSRTPCR